MNRRMPLSAAVSEACEDFAIILLVWMQIIGKRISDRLSEFGDWLLTTHPGHIFVIATTYLLFGAFIGYALARHLLW